MALEPGEHCGHDCCDIPNAPHHQHFLGPEECGQCKGVRERQAAATRAVEAAAVETRFAIGDRPKSKRADGRHAWRFDGDDPYTVCAYCGERRDSLTGRVFGEPAPADSAGEAVECSPDRSGDECATPFDRPCPFHPASAAEAAVHDALFDADEQGVPDDYALRAAFIVKRLNTALSGPHGREVAVGLGMVPESKSCRA